MAKESKKRLLEEQSNVDSQDNKVSGSELLEMKEVTDTPFVLIKSNEVWRIAVGNKIVCEIEFKDSEEALAYIDAKPYKLLLNLMLIVKEIKL